MVGVSLCDPIKFYKILLRIVYFSLESVGARNMPEKTAVSKLGVANDTAIQLSIILLQKVTARVKEMQLFVPFDKPTIPTNVHWLNNGNANITDKSENTLSLRPSTACPRNMIELIAYRGEGISEATIIHRRAKCYLAHCFFELCLDLGRILNTVGAPAAVKERSHTLPWLYFAILARNEMPVPGNFANTANNRIYDPPHKSS